MFTAFVAFNVVIGIVGRNCFVFYCFSVEKKVFGNLLCDYYLLSVFFVSQYLILLVIIALLGEKKIKNKFVTLVSLTIVGLLVASTFAAISAETIIDKEFDGKGAIAQWNITTGLGDHIINAIVDKSNSGKDGNLYVSIIHPTKGISEASGPADFKWSMNHVTVEATLTFSGPGRSGTHMIIIRWQTDGPTSNDLLSADTGNGLIAEIDGDWKFGAAELGIMDSTGHHQGDFYPSLWAIVVHGAADISITAP